MTYFVHIYYEGRGKLERQFKIFCETNEHTWISSSSFNYKRAMELAEKFYDKMNKNELYQI